ncbi:MAG TPA: hypothetical protein VF857_05030 [Spirochaetota bacterium]
MLKRYLVSLIAIIAFGFVSVYGAQIAVTGADDSAEKPTASAEKASRIVDPSPVIKGVEGLAGVWEDTETHDLHTIKQTADGYSVESIIDYGGNGKEVEKMNLVLSEWKKGSLKWGYFVPSTGYYVFFSAISVNGDKLLIKWANDDGKGNIRKGKDLLKRMMASASENSVSASDAKNPAKLLYGKIYKITGNEIIVASRNPGAVLPIGDVLYLMVDGEKVFLDVVFPMQTVAKCKVKGKSMKFKDRITLNAEVYK